DEAVALEPVLRQADQDGGHIMIHPGLRADQELSVPKFADHHQHRASTIALQTALSHVMVTLMFGDLTERFPNISFQVINLGGTLPYLLERMDEVSRLRTPDDPLPSSRARRVYVDSASLGPRALELAVRTYGADRIMLGSDFPIFTGDGPRRAVEEAAIGDDDKRRILSGTATAIIDRLA
ncbi:MAG: amidohydrolase family protein, partial [Alphaproteobacteria bacterium]